VRTPRPSALHRGSARFGVLGLAIALALAGAAHAVPAAEPGDMALGSPKAPVTVIEYASVGCPHCAMWNNQIFPTIRTQYVATGKARFVVREMLFGDPSLAAAGFMLARCAGPAKYFPMIDAIYLRQDSMYVAGAEPRAILKNIAKTVGGLSDAGFEACLADKQALAAVNARSEQHRNVDKIEETPTFFLNGQRLAAELAPGDLAKAVQAAGAGPATGHRR
jgi:protein-disulfide isomerase